VGIASVVPHEAPSRIELGGSGGVGQLLEAYRATLASPPGWPGARRLEVERIRRGLVCLQRRLAVRIAFGVDAEDEARHARVGAFLDSLPPAPSRLWFAGLGLAIVGIARLLVALVAANNASPVVAQVFHSTLAGELKDPTSVVALGRALAAAGPRIDVMLAWAVLLATVAVLAVALPAHRVAQRRCARFAEAEQVAFRAVGAAPPQPLPLALQLRTAGAGALLTAGVHLLLLARYEGNDGREVARWAIGAAIVAAASLWFWRLAVAWRGWRRDQPSYHGPCAPERDAV
jgi:hypothetical protein